MRGVGVYALWSVQNSYCTAKTRSYLIKKDAFGRETGLFPDILIYDKIDNEEGKGNDQNFRGQGVTGVSFGIGI